MALWDSLLELGVRERDTIIYRPIDRAHVDVAIEDAHAEAGRHYVRLRLADMFLKHEVRWFRTLFPAVHSLVRFDFGSQRVEIPNVADSSRVGMQQGVGGDIVARNFVLTPTVPFNGGIIELDAGLLAIEGENYLGNFIHALGGFASLLAVPQLSAVIGLAQPLAAGVQDLLGGGNGRRHIGLHDSFTADQLKPGYLAVIRASESDLPLERLYVVGDQLRQGTGLAAGQHGPLVGYDYMLFRLEVFEDRDDLEQLTSIWQPLSEARSQLRNQDEKKAEFYLLEAKQRAYDAPELTRVDRRRAITVLNEQYQQARDDFLVAGLRASRVPDPTSAMRRSMSAESALEAGQPTLSEALAVPGR
jgi:hypothetical protein